MAFFTKQYWDNLINKKRQSQGPANPEAELLSDEIREIMRQIDDINKHMGEEKNTINNENNNINNENNILIQLQKRLQELLELLRRTQNTETEYNKIKFQINTIREKIKLCNGNLIHFKTIIVDSTNRLQQNLSDFEVMSNKYKELVKTKSIYDAQLEIDNMDINKLSGIISELRQQIITLNKTIAAEKLIIEDLNENVTSLNNKIEQLLIKIYSNVIYNNQNILKLKQTIDTSFNLLFSYLNKQNTPSTVYHEKIMYRDIEHEKLYNTNKILDILFYCFYFSFILIIICIGNINREKFLIYLFVLLIHFIYPFLFKFILFLIHYLSNNSHGPKNAFVDINNTIYA